jgi:hypothetical protein
MEDVCTKLGETWLKIELTTDALLGTPISYWNG